MQKRLFPTLLLLSVLSFHFDAGGQEPPEQPSKEPAKIELGAQF